MFPVAAAFGVVTLGAFFFVVIGLLRQLGAGEAAKGLMILTGIVVACVVAATYVPFLIASI